MCVCVCVCVCVHVFLVPYISYKSAGFRWVSDFTTRLQQWLLGKSPALRILSAAAAETSEIMGSGMSMVCDITF